MPVAEGVGSSRHLAQTCQSVGCCDRGRGDLEDPGCGQRGVSHGTIELWRAELLRLVTMQDIQAAEVVDAQQVPVRC